MPSTRWQPDMSVTEQSRDVSGRVRAHHPIGPPMLETHILQPVEIAQQFLPFRRDVCFAQNVIEMLLHREGQEGTKTWQSEDKRQFPGGLNSNTDRPTGRLAPQGARCGLTRTPIDQPCLSLDLSTARERLAVRLCLADACDPRRA